MARRYEKVMNIKVFPNSEGAAKYGNSNWTPWKDGSNADIYLSGNKKYSVRVFEEEDGKLSISITEPIDVQGTDSLSNDLQQGGMRKLADTQAVKRGLSISDDVDDDIPF
tara:strand:+ start:108 stop:437 length:330 start_codon:yes stop_codon:yes gene_type:complete